MNKAENSTPDGRGTAAIWLIIVVSALGPLSLNILLPTMPLLEAAFDTSYERVALTLTLFLAGFAICQLVYGPLSDRYGRRPLMLIGVGIYTAGSVIAWLAPSIEVLILGRLIQAMGGCAGLVLGRAIIRDRFSREESASAMALVTAVMVLAPMVSPKLGSHLQEWFGWRSVMLVTAVTGMIALFLAWQRLGETLKEKVALPSPMALMATYGSLLRQRAYQIYTAQIAFTSAAFFCFLGGAPYVVQNQMGETAQVYATWFMISATGYMSGNFFSAKFSARIGSDRMIWIGLSVTCLASGAAVLLSGMLHPIALFGPMIVLALGNGIALPNGIAAAVSVNPRLAGTGSGLAGFFQMGLGALGSYAAGMLAPLGATQFPLTVMMFIMTAIALLVGFGHARSSDPQIVSKSKEEAHP